MMKLLCKIDSISDRFFNYLSPLFLLIARVYIAKIFFMSALTKIENWQSTLYLFEHEYNVPVLSANLAAYFGTAAELILPILILFGFGSRLMILALFLFNIVATASYSFLWSEEGAAGLHDHLQWGLILLILMGTGYGKLSIDALFSKLCKRK